MQLVKAPKPAGQALFPRGSIRGESGRQGGRSRRGARGGCNDNLKGPDGGRGSNSDYCGGSTANPDGANTNEQPNSCLPAHKSQWQISLP